jgi:hypothetical protein
MEPGELTLDKRPDHASRQRRPRGSEARPYLKARLADSKLFVFFCRLDWERRETVKDLRR